MSFIEGKNAKPEALAESALKDEKALQQLLDGVLSKKDVVRQNSFQALNFLSEKHPESLYCRWDFFADMLAKGNSFHKYIAIYIITNLTAADAENKFEKLFDTYYGLLGDESIIPAAHVAASSGKIALAKPALQTAITDRLLDIDNVVQKHKDLVKASAIEAFDTYFDKSRDQERIIAFVRAQLNCESPKTRKKAKEFLKKWSKE
jgi:HEAT repeat protein